MSTSTTEADWDLALAVFRACLPARCATAWGDELLLQTLHHFTVHTITWRALPERVGLWNSVLTRFDRPSKTDVFEDSFCMSPGLFCMSAGLSGTADLVPMFVPTMVPTHVSAAGAKGAGRPCAWPLARRGRHDDPCEDPP